MSNIYGDVFQVAYVVPDLDKAIAHWTEKLCVGPFFTFPLPLPFSYLKIRDDDVAGDTPVFGGVAISFSGDMMIELIQPGEAHTTYTEFLESGQSGIHHFGTFTDRFDDVLADARSRGTPFLLEGALPMSRFVYLDTYEKGLSPIIEVVEPHQPMLDTFAMIKDAAKGWDGKDPVRSL
ncbi:hypothetical protein GCM10011371_08160 [Novosphingobium marinum]|uniref:VOC domain-containing protein n=1 Tax=Novosphingobium marinum TaxID=1514948 RepID=A0A7Z0BSU4_9SPHN|nr:VOC family protein [Novosphingobium marinum]NYH94504.1 hypothetical protein [Novosphingobium marinum]GGC22853.1 hypothetical protein GCM10011371_08160 [Novosphingobium marinum]